MLSIDGCACARNLDTSGTKIIVRVIFPRQVEGFASESKLLSEVNEG